MAEFINELHGYQPIPRDLIESDDLSIQARMLYCIMAVKPKGWKYLTDPLQKQMHINDVRTFRKYRDELISAGWLVMEEQSRENGQFGANVYRLKANNTDVQKMHNGNATDVQKMPYGNESVTATDAQHNNTHLTDNTHLDTNHTHTPRACEDEEKRRERSEEILAMFKKQYPNLVHLTGWTEATFNSMFKRCDGDWKQVRMILSQMNNKPDLMAQRADLYTTFVSFLDNNKMKPL